jgi:cytochrome c biogenesis protein CcmG/thiol:disulfide interchange protein DsbE
MVKLFDTNQTVNTIEIFQSERLYLLNIWSSWCVPCREEHPFLMELKKNKQLKVVGMNYKDTKKNAKNFLEELGNPYDKIIFDNKGTNAIEWGAYGVPESFLINKDKIIKKYIGPLNQQSIEEIKSYIK